MSETKEMLEATVKGLQEKIVSLQHDLREKEKDLEDVNKPVISHDVMCTIEDTVNRVIEDYNFDCGMFEYEFNLNYDNKLELSDLTFTDAYDLVEEVVTCISRQFKVLKPEDNEKTNE